jgi:predicted DNA-binding transcriptional regulator YafY
MRERFLLDVPGWYRSADDVPHLSEVAEAVWDQRPLHMTYRRWGKQEVDRVIHPYGLVLKGGSWYLVAAPPGGSPRTYRVARILTLETMPGRFARPEGFELATFWREYAREFRERMYTAEAVIKLAPGRGDLLAYTMGADVVGAALAAAEEPDPEGWLTLTVPVESLTHARWLLLRMGADVEVLGPPELRTLMSEAVTDLAKLYG